MRSIYFLAGLAFLFSCQSAPVETKMEEIPVDSTRKIILRLDPPDRSAYTYHIANETVYKIKVNDQDITTGNVTNIQYDYLIQKDSSGGFNISIIFRHIKVITDKDGKKTEADADNAALSIHPVEKMLGILKDQKMEVKIDEKGSVQAIKGYDELGYKFIAQFAEDDSYGRTTAKAQWDQLITNGLIKGQVNHLFKALPDTEVYTGYTWTSNEKTEGDMPMHVESTMKIKDIDSTGQVVFLTESRLRNAGNSFANIPGAQMEEASLSGTRIGTTRINMQTGMIEKSDYKGKISGTVIVMGNIVPLVIENKVTIEGRRR